MSLIINMLKDLEKRQNINTAIPSMMTSHQHYASPENKLHKKIALGIFILLFSAIFIYFIMHKTTSRNLLPLPNASTIVKTDEAINQSDAAWLTHAAINGISFETKDNATEITILLTHGTLYRLVSTDNNQLSIYFDNAAMESDLPTLAGSETRIKSITTASTNGTLKLNISLQHDAFVKSVNLNKEDKNPELIISISNNKSVEPDVVFASTTIPNTASNIKTPAMQSIIVEKYRNAVKLAESGNKKDAIINLTKLLAYYPDYNDVRVSLAAIHLESGNPVLARKIIDEGLAISPDYLPLIELKARVLTSEGKIKDALMVLQSEQPLISDAPGYHAFLAALYNRENNYQLAADIYKKLVQINPHEGSWWFGLAVSLDKLGINQDATYAYTKAATEGRLNAQALAFLQTRLRSLREETHAKE